MQRLDMLLDGKKPDRIPCTPVLACGYAGRITNTPFGELYKEPKKCIKAQLLAAEMHDYEALPLYGYAAFGAWEFGGEIELPFEKGFSPTVSKVAVDKPEHVEDLRIPDPKLAGSLPAVHEASREAARLKHPVVFPSGSVFTWACNVLGFETAMSWTILEPDLVHKVLKKCADFAVAIAEDFVEEFGPEKCIAADLAPAEANSLISPRQFEGFALPYTMKVHEKILGMGVDHFLTHICGEQNANLQHWQKIPHGRPGILSFGSEVDIDTANRIFGKDHVIMGNINTTEMMLKPFDEVFRTCRQAVEKGKKAPVGYIISPGCEIPPVVPPVNVYAMVKAAKEFGVYSS